MGIYDFPKNFLFDVVVEWIEKVTHGVQEFIHEVVVIVNRDIILLDILGILRFFKRLSLGSFVL